MSTQIIILEIIGIAILVFLVLELRRKAPTIAQDAAAMEQKAMADLHALWLDEIQRSRALADQAAQDAHTGAAALGEKMDRLMVAINREFVPIHTGLGALRAKVDGLLAPKPATQPESPLPDVTKAIDAGAAKVATAAPDTPEDEVVTAAAADAPDVISSPGAGDAAA